MKIDNNTLQTMENDLTIVINHLGIDKKILNENEINYLWFITWCNRTYLDNNLNVKKDKNGKRILAFIDRDYYDLYPCNTNDTTIYTAWKKLKHKWNNE